MLTFVMLMSLGLVPAQDLPAALFALGAGFSCKSFSKMHKDFQEFLTAMADNSDESQSTVIIFFNFNLCLRKHSLNLFVVKYSIQSGLVVLCPINHTKDSSSVMTFKCVLQLLQTVFVRTFLLENVDLEETSKSTSKESNLQVILRALSEARDGYHVRAFKILSKDFGVPQRRVRLFFIGVHKGTYPNFDMDKVAQNLEKFRLKCQKPDTFMY